MRSTRRCGRTILPPSSARGPTASCCPRRAPARTCTSCRSPCIMPRSVPGIDGRDADHRHCDRGGDLAPQARYLRGRQRAPGGAHLGCRGPRRGGGGQTNREADGSWTSPYRLARDLCLFTAVAANAQPIDTVFVDFRDEQGFRAEAALPPATASRARWPSTPTRSPRSTRSSRRRPRRSPAQAIVKAFADTPDAGVLAIAGHMVDRAHVKGAERILARVKSVGQV